MVDSCIFCGRRPTTREHLFPAWLSTVLPRMPKAVISTVNLRLTSAGALNVWDPGGGSPQLTTKLVCIGCNGGWMSGIEAQAKSILEPMILGDNSRRPMLSKADQQRIASWACLKAIVGRGVHGEYFDLEGEWIADFYQKQQIPSSWRVWLSAYDGQHVCLYDGYDLGDASLLSPIADSPELNSETNYHGLLSTFVVGFVAIKVMGVRWPDRLGSPAPEALHRIFPPERDNVMWPPGEIITDVTLPDYLGLFLKGGSHLGNSLAQGMVNAPRGY